MNMISHHFCRWPGCDRKVSNQHWGCVSHWDKIPGHLRIAFRKAHDPNAGTVSDAALKAAQEIQIWIAAQTQCDAAAAALKPTVDIEFAAGITNKNEVFMLWPDGTFMTIDRVQARMVVRAIRAMLSPDGHP